MPEFHVQMKDFGRYLDVWVIDRRPHGTVQTILAGPEEPGGEHLFREEVLAEGVRSSPSFSIPVSWVGPLVDALTDHMPTKIDKVILDRLDKETERVDKMLTYLMEGHG